MTLGRSTRRVPAVIVVLATCGLLAACGSSNSSSSTSTVSGSASNASASTGTASARGTAFRNCLRAHGVNLPARRPGTGTRQRTPGGGLFFGGGTGGGFARNPKLAAAIQACGGGRFFGAGRRARISHQAITAFVSCVRKHGYPTMPNPNFSGTGPVFRSSIRTNPKFVTASKSCASLLTPPAWSGAPAGAPPLASASS